MLATCSPDQTTRLWEVATGELLNTFHGQADEVFDVAFSSDGKLLASLGCYDAVVKFWNPNTRPRREVIRGPGKSNSGTIPVGFDTAGGLASFVWPGMQPAVLDPVSLQATLAPVPVCREGVDYQFRLGSVSANGQFQGLRSLDEKLVEIWDRSSGKLLRALPSHFSLVSFDSRRQLVATVTTNSVGTYNTTVWHLPTGVAKWVLTNAAPTPHAFAGDGQHLLIQDETQLQLWRIEGESLNLAQAIPNRGGFGDTVVSPDGHLLAAFRLGDIEVWELPSATMIAVLKGHIRKGARLAFSPDGRTLASICDDRTLRLWHITTQRELLQFQSPNEDRGDFRLEFSPDGRALAASRVDDEGEVAWLYYAPSFAEIAVAEGRDYRSEAGDDPATWLAVAKALLRKERWQEATQAFDEVLNRTANQDDLAWLRANALRHRVQGLKRLDDASPDNR
jgi:WD40 repeat protein